MRKFICTILSMMLIISSLSIHAAASDLQASEQTEHTHSYDILKSDTATCSQSGIAVYLCACGAEMEKNSDATGNHTYGPNEYLDTVSHKAVCTDCDEECLSPHTWDSGQMITEANCIQEGEQLFSCMDCGGTYTRDLPITGHSYDPALSDDVHHICGICKSAETHLWDEGEVAKKPTCASEGAFIYHCLICQMKLTEVLEKRNTHTYDSACDPKCNVCGSERAIEHTFTTIWSKNYKGHWHECTKCGEQRDFEKHDAGPAATEDRDQVCLVCKYLIEPKKNHIHKYEKQRSYDEVGHWFACTGCGNEKEYASHDFESDCDPDCEICGYERDNMHKYSEPWMISTFEHWMVCSLCGEENEREKHIPGPVATDKQAQLCTVCSFELVAKQEHTHDFGSKWSQTEDHHWQECSCGEQSVPMSHVWDSGQEHKKGIILYTCVECGLEKAVETPASGVSGMIVLLIMLALACLGGIGVLFITLKRGALEHESGEEEEDIQWNNETDSYQ